MSAPAPETIPCPFGCGANIPNVPGTLHEAGDHGWLVLPADFAAQLVKDAGVVEMAPGLYQLPPRP